MKLFKVFRKRYHPLMTWITHTNGQKAFHGTTAAGGKFAVVEGMTPHDMRGFIEHLEKSAHSKNKNVQPAADARLDPQVRVSV